MGQWIRCAPVWEKQREYQQTHPGSAGGQSPTQLSHWHLENFNVECLQCACTMRHWSSWGRLPGVHCSLLCVAGVKVNTVCTGQIRNQKANGRTLGNPTLLTIWAKGEFANILESSLSRHRTTEPSQGNCHTKGLTHGKILSIPAFIWTLSSTQYICYFFYLQVIVPAC